MSTPDDPRRRWLLWLETALWLGGSVLLLYSGWLWTRSHLYQLRAGRYLSEVASGSSPGHAPGTTASHTGTPAEEDPRPGDPIARVRIPRLGLSAVVAEGTSKDVLSRAVGHLETSAPPGGEGNVALAGHCETFFEPLEEIRRGDRIWLDSPAGDAVYQVEWIRVVEPSGVDVTADAGYPALTLLTQYPFHVLGWSPLRLVVRARRTTADEAAGGPPRPARPAPHGQPPGEPERSTALEH